MRLKSPYTPTSTGGVMDLIQRFIKDESGATAIEYGLIAAWLLSRSLQHSVCSVGHSTTCSPMWPRKERRHNRPIVTLNGISLLRLQSPCFSHGWLPLHWGPHSTTIFWFDGLGLGILAGMQGTWTAAFRWGTCSHGIIPFALRALGGGDGQPRGRLCGSPRY